MFICLPIHGPSQAPATMPGVSKSAMRHCTAWCRWWARTEDTEVNKIVASEVAIAMCNTSSGAIWRAVKIIAMKGTKIMPPPMPSKPARKPPHAPISSNCAIKPAAINRSASA